MRSLGHGPNVIDVGGAPMLLTTTGGGVAVHLTRLAEAAETGIEALPEFYFEAEWSRQVATLASYDRAALTQPRWSPTTVCGREWAIMVGGEAGPVSRSGEVAFAPSCRRCLALIDRHFPTPQAAPRLDLVAQVAADTVIGHRGYVEIHHVPGDQQQALRQAVRSLIRRRTGHSVRTHVINEAIYVVCEAIHDQHALEDQRDAADAVGRYLAGEPPLRTNREWVVDWNAWEVG
jgi:hypothetical protein